MIKVFWNGLKSTTEGGKIQKAHYWLSEAGYIKVYASDYKGFSPQVCIRFKVENNTDSQVDYFEKDSFKVFPSDPAYNDFMIALKQFDQRYRDMKAKRLERSQGAKNGL
jgi:hypothetical protein